MRLLTRYKYSILSPFIPRFVKIPLRRWLYLYWTKRGDFWERDMEFLGRFIRRGDFVIDVGASTGYYTNRLSKLVGDYGRVYAYEPNPESFNILKYVTKELLNVIIDRIAISNEKGLSILKFMNEVNGEDNLVGASIEEYPIGRYDRTQLVTTTTLDSLFGELFNISFIKIDTEGHDYYVLMGAEKLIKRCRPVILVEILDNPKESKITNFLNILGYKIEKEISQHPTYYFTPLK